MTDPYLDFSLSVSRLVTEYNKYQSLVIAYDYDNTVFDYHNQGYTFDKVIDLLRFAKSCNCYLIVFTSCPQSKYPEIRDYLTANNIPFDAINEDAPFLPITGNRKIYFNHLLDDRAGLPLAYHILQKALDQIAFNIKPFKTKE